MPNPKPFLSPRSADNFQLSKAGDAFSSYLNIYILMANGKFLQAPTLLSRRVAHDIASVHAILKPQGKFASRSLKSTLPKAGHPPRGCANLSPPYLSVKGHCVCPEAAAMQPSPPPSCFAAALPLPPLLCSHLVIEDGPRELLPAQKCRHLWE